MPGASNCTLPILLLCVVGLLKKSQGDIRRNVPDYAVKLWESPRESRGLTRKDALRGLVERTPGAGELDRNAGAVHVDPRMAREPESPADLPVHLAPMGDADDLDDARTIINLIHDPVIADTNAIAVRPFELRGPGRPRLLF